MGYELIWKDKLVLQEPRVFLEVPAIKQRPDDYEVDYSKWVQLLQHLDDYEVSNTCCGGAIYIKRDCKVTITIENAKELPKVIDWCRHKRSKVLEILERLRNGVDVDAIAEDLEKRCLVFELLYQHCPNCKKEEKDP